MLNGMGKKIITILPEFFCLSKPVLCLLIWRLIKAAYSVTFDIFILKIMFLFFKNTVKILKFRYRFYLFRNN